jgi:hypothetical protein
MKVYAITLASILVSILLLGVVAHWPTLAPYVKRWLLNVIYAIDILANTVIGGDPTMTISERAARSQKKWGCVLCKMLDWLDPNHCEDALKKREPGSWALQEVDDR